MQVSELIKKLENFKAQHGDLECFSSSYFADVSPRLETGEGHNPDWNMPERFVVIGDSN